MRAANFFTLARASVCGCAAMLVVVSAQTSSQNSGLPAAAGSGPAQCQVRVVANDLVVSSTEWSEVGHDVLPVGIAENPDQWPYFAWSDTPLGVVRSRQEPLSLTCPSSGT